MILGPSRPIHPAANPVSGLSFPSHSRIPPPTTTTSSANFQSILDSALDSNAEQIGIDHTKHLSTDKLQCLVRAGVNFQDRVGWSLLHVASSLGHCDLRLLLLENSADANVKKKYG